MKDGFIKVAAASVEISVADVYKNAQLIKDTIQKAENLSVNLLVLPELCLTGYTCGDLFFNETLISACESALTDITEFTRDKNLVSVIGLPLKNYGKLYNCAAVVFQGEILGVIPKSFIPGYGEYKETRYFESGKDLSGEIVLNGVALPFGTDLVFAHETLKNYTFGVEICEDLWVPCSPSVSLCMGGANIILNPTASSEFVGKTDKRYNLVKNASQKQICGYVLANASFSESTTDTVFSSHNLIAENGKIVAQSVPFSMDNEILVSDIDVDFLSGERIRKNTFYMSENECNVIPFNQKIVQTEFTRKVSQNPFVSDNKETVEKHTETVFNAQCFGLKKRIEHTNAKTAVIGVSGGLDSTLALLVTANTFKILGKPSKDIVAVTMPGFGTTDRTYNNAVKLCKLLGTDLKEINISKSVLQHFEDIGHDVNTHDATYENSQARERTQILMDLGNKLGGIVVGTGDLSELALGWATYNGDHMSMYGVNSGVPKTMVRCLVKTLAEKSDGELKSVLTDILNTPVSPELLPTDKDGNIAQKTEDLLGPYELHDFFIFYSLRCGFSPRKILRLALSGFSGVFSKDEILRCLEIFYRRFFSQQFKRSCLPDGVKVGSVSLSPRGDLALPSDACAALWLKELENLR